MLEDSRVYVKATGGRSDRLSECDSCYDIIIDRVDAILHLERILFFFSFSTATATSTTLNWTFKVPRMIWLEQEVFIGLQKGVLIGIQV